MPGADVGCAFARSRCGCCKAVCSLKGVMGSEHHTGDRAAPCRVLTACVVALGNRAAGRPRDGGDDRFDSDVCRHAAVERWVSLPVSTPAFPSLVFALRRADVMGPCRPGWPFP
eukprot:2819235-Rhodomonas_salina.1